MKGAAPVAAMLAALAPSPAEASAPAYRFAIPAGPLTDMVVTVGTTAGVTIGIVDPSLRSVTVRAVHGRMTVAQALERSLAGTAAGFVQVDAQTVRIVRRPVALARPRTPPASPRPPGPAIADGADDIVVQGSKRSATLEDYAGAVSIVDTATLMPGERLHGSGTLLRQVPALASTHLGPGRNKLFIRGIADSSFNGPTQATVGQYLGNIRLNYNAPDPDLALYDTTSVEILEGPQGTLYGAGSLGGVIQIEPVPPDLSHASADLSVGVSATAHGAPGMDGAVIVNIPLDRDRLALRVVGYGGIDGGYIDDPLRHLSDINRTATRGARATLRFRPAADWTFDLNGVLQNVDSRDGQYATRGLPPLQRESVIAQPFDNDYALAGLVVRHDMGGTSLTSATSGVFHDLNITYDASPSPASPTRYQEDHRIRLLTNETRLAHRSASGANWVAGVEILHSSDRLTRTLGPIGAENPISGVKNAIDQISLFGEATLPLTGRLFATGGARFAYSRLVDEVLDSPTQDDNRHRHDFSALPSAGLLWKWSARWSAYARYQEGDRPGGLSVESGGTQHFHSDSLASWEAGVRFGTARDRLSGGVTGSLAHWHDIQADLVDLSGLPYTANIGSGRLLGIEGHAVWRPVPALSIQASIFANDSQLSRPAPAFSGERDATLPNIADLTARLAGRYGNRLFGHPIELSASATYIGHSRLGVGPSFDLRQGGYFDTMAGVSLSFTRWTLSLDAANLLDQRRNMFALGDPFGVTEGRQITPLRPRTIRIGVDAHF